MQTLHRYCHLGGHAQVVLAEVKERKLFSLEDLVQWLVWLRSVQK